jgi:hypothetical protein
MDVQITEGYDLRAVLEGAARPGIWVGDGAAALGLTGEVDPADFEALSELVTEKDQGQDDEMSPYEAKPAGGFSLIEQMRLDGTL